MQFEQKTIQNNLNIWFSTWN